MANPSPLSNPVSAEPESPGKVTSPAAQQLSALTERDANKGMKSRLRRAFSFGSAAELRRASAENLSKKDRTHEDIEAEHEAIARKQEAAGIGAGIYSGQGGFSGSTDNLSISSTASSASIMLRKMGKGMKKGTRSLKGLFRPKSVVGVPAADAPLTQPSVAQVSMVTVEAEREKVNVNANPHDQNGGGTGFPRLERNSLDTTVVASDPPGFSSGKASVESWSRKSIVGGDRERAEVLAAVKKGILKSKCKLIILSPPNSKLDFILTMLQGEGPIQIAAHPSFAPSTTPTHLIPVLQALLPTIRQYNSAIAITSTVCLACQPT